jgi:hypothetical protein
MPALANSRSTSAADCIFIHAASVSLVAMLMARHHRPEVRHDDI